jgi:hypothetical protein
MASRPLIDRGPDLARLTARPGQASHESYRSKSHFKGEAKTQKGSPKVGIISWLYNKSLELTIAPQHTTHRRKDLMS